ncbi:MAG: cyclic nucleotide-binding domain-containing protein [Nitrospiraceae bacterium]|nr:cyclic nucleotide-binding domain-containing protein [Nitrospiraceae bacterium]
MSSSHWETYFDSVKGQDWGRAERVLLELSKKDAGNPQVYLKLGDIYQRMGDSANAVAYYHRAALILAGRGFNQKALALYKIILRLAPYDMDAMDRSRQLVEEMDAAPAMPPPAVPTQVSDAFSETDSSSAAPAVSSTGRLEPTAHEHSLTEASGMDEAAAVPPAVPSLFAGMSAEEFGRALENFELLSFVDGRRVIVEGDSGDSLYIIKSGKAMVRAHILGKEIQLALLAEGDVFGEVSFLTGRPRTADVIAAGPLEVYEVGRLAIEAVLEKNPGVLSRLEEFYERRVRDTILKVK